MPDQSRKIVRQAAGWRGLKGLLSLALVALTGCFGPPTMHYDIQEYNKQVVSSEQEMLLYNIGRLNRKQPPHFMMLSSVSQSRTFSAGTSFQWMSNPSIWTVGPFTAGGNENPTITFVPIQGQDFAQRFESPLTDKFTLFMEDREWYATAAEKEAIVLLFAQSLLLLHGDDDKCQEGKTGFYVNRPPDPQDQYPAETKHYSELSACVNEIVESAPYYDQIDGSYPVPTKASEDPKAADLVTALGAGYEWTKAGDEFTLATPVRIPAWFDFDPKSVEPHAPKKPASSAPVFWVEGKPTWQRQQYTLPKGYKWKVYKVNKNDKRGAKQVYALVPDGYDLEREKNGTLKRENREYVLAKSVEAAPHRASGRRVNGDPTIYDT